jgi:two-component system sensor histidine kinase TctE
VSRPFSLRRRLLLSLAGVFVFGVAATTVFFALELHELRQRLENLPATRAGLLLEFDSLLVDQLEYFGLVLVPCSVAAFAVIAVLTRSSLRGVQRASAAAARIDIERLDFRLDTDGVPAEIVPLVQAMNGCLERLATAYTAERRLTANAAHELRTPLTVLRARLQAAKLEGVVDWPTIERDLARLERVIAQTLDLARKERRPPVRDAPAVNIARVLREAAAQILPLIEHTGRTVEVDAPDRIMVAGLEDDLRDMLRNLLENALHHGAGPIRSVARVTQREGASVVRLRICDEGSGVPEALRERVFERFTTGPAASAGAGLAIVRQVARDHGGDAHVAADAPSCLEVELPLLVTATAERVAA